MTIAQQAFHIFKKDFRYLRRDLAALFVFCLFLVWYWTDPWTADSSVTPVRWRAREVTGPYVAAVWFLLIARLMHAEPLVGDRHFWLTRPYSRTALLLAKGLFVIAFLLLPLLVVQMLAVSRSGLPVSLGALLVNQLGIAAVVCLPAAAVASMTRSLWQYVPVVAAGAVAATAIWLETSIRFDGSVPFILGVALLGACSLGALLMQFQGRRTLRNATLYVSACVAVWLLVTAFPRDLARTAASVLDGASARESVTFDIAASARQNATVAFASPDVVRPPWRGRPEIWLPLEATDAAVRDLALRSPTVTMRTATGQTHRLAASLWGDDSGYSLVTSAVILRDGLFGPRTLATIPTAIMNEPVSLHIELWVKRFRDAATATLPTDGSAVLLDGSEQCRSIPLGSLPSLSPSLSTSGRSAAMCRHAVSAFPWEEENLRSESVVESRILAYSPAAFPTIDPIMTVQLPPYGYTNRGVLTVDLRERVAFFRATFVVENVRLAEYVVR